MLTPYLPYPLLTGGQTRSYNLIKRLHSLGHEITLFCLVKDGSERRNVRQLQEFCKEVQVFKRSREPWTIGNILKTCFSFYPFLVIRNWARGEENAIAQKLIAEKFDLIHAETFYVMPHIPETKVPILLVEQTIEYLVYRHFVDEFKLPVLKPLLYIDVWKMKYWELRYWQLAARVVAMSEDDKQTMLKEVGELDVDIVPNGVDNEYFGKLITPRFKEQVVLYLGNFTWLQNREAVSVLMKKVWPKIKAKLPRAKLWIVGKDAPNFFAKLVGSDVKVMEVTDVREVYQKASVLVAPIYGGGGTRYKNFEAFASGLPVVTTSIGIRGTDANDGTEVVIRDDPGEIAEAAIKLLTNQSFSNLIAANARRMVRKKYDWDPIAKKLSTIYEALGVDR